MEKKIEDYLHLYIGCECLQPFKDKGKTHVISIHTNGLVQVAHSTGSQDFWNIEYIKPILRPLSDMTEEEKMDLHWKNQSPELLRWMREDNYAIKCSEFKYLLSKHFDLFGLIESGLAVDATTLKK